MRTSFLFPALPVCAIASLLATAALGAGKLPERRSPAIDPAFTPPAITVPPGFVVELVAGPPLIKHPIMAGFDDRGRLFVSETAGQNLKNNELDQQLPNYITVLEDTDADGFFDKSALFADKMTFPQGALWLNGALYVASPPGLWRLEDTNGDGTADQRTQLVTGFDYTGNAADVHGPFLGPTGRLYWCHGRKGHEVRQPDGTLVSKGKGARIWSCKPDGSDIQVHAGGGMDNPVEVDFMPEGDLIGTVNLFHGRPRGDTLVHWLHGGAYPRHDQEPVIAEFKRTGDLLPEIFNYGHVAVSGMTRYRSAAFGEEYQNNLFITYFNTQKVTRSILTREGSSYRCRNVDFFYADSTDVHVTDVLEDADGSLLVIDTGGWFRIGCPTSQIAKPDIYGAIYRIRRTDAKVPADPRGLKIDWRKAPSKELAKLLDDERFAVRERAISVLAHRGEPAIAELAMALQSTSARARLNAVWTLARIGSPKAQAALRSALKDEDGGVRQAACQSVGELKDKQAVSVLMALIQKDEPAVQREAATALGRMGETRAVEPLLAALARPADRSLEHALIYALIEINQPDAVLPALSSHQPGLQRRALIALDQMDQDQLAPAAVLAAFDSPDEALRLAAIDVLKRRTNWAADAATLFDKWQAESALTEHRQQVLAGVLPRLLSHEQVQAVTGKLLSRWKTDAPLCKIALQAISQAGGAHSHASWQKPFDEILNSGNHEMTIAAVSAIATLKSSAFDDQLRRISADASSPVLLRIKATAAVAPRTGSLSDGTFALLIEQMTPGVSSAIRAEACHTLSVSKLSRTQLLELTRVVSAAGPLELPILIGAFNQNREPEVGNALLAALSNSPALTTLKVPDLKKLFQRYPAGIVQLAQPMLDDLTAQAAEQTTRLLKVDAELPTGNAERGQDVFFSQAAVCGVCHRVGDQGGEVGPDLSRIGRIRTQRDLLEAILYPSASFARDYESYTVFTKDGESQTGVILRETSDAVYLANVSGTAAKIPRAAIERIALSQLSTMPQGLEHALSREQLADLIAYLRNLQ